MSQPSPNSLISHYRIVSKLGAGGMGEVWLAEDTRLGRKVALKLLPSEFTEDSERVRRFTQEAKAASALSHPNIISVFDIGESEIGRFIVMEFVSGQTLRHVIAQENSVQNLFAFGPQMAKALNAAHDAGITHRDIKPDNIMVRDDGYVKMLDFGLARLLPTTSSDPEGATLAQQTTPGTVMGTLAYMSPEQAIGKLASASSDVFSLGVVLYELATGRHPFRSETMIGYLHAITSQTPPSMSSVKPGLSPALDDLILRMLEKVASDRPTASEVAQALTDIERHGTTSALPPRTLIKKPEVSTPIQDEGFWVAVLPFKYRGSNADLEALAEGLSDDIITGLSRFSYLHVIARGSTLRYANETTDLRAVGKELGARYVMEGNVRQAGMKMRLAVQLVDTTNGAQLWAETYERTFSSESVFELQDELVPPIVSTIADLHGVLPRSMSLAVRGMSLDQLTPYEAVLRSFGYSERVTPEGLADVLTALEVAVQKAPTYGDAWAMLAAMCTQDYGQGFGLRSDPLALAKAAAHRAVELAPSNHLAWGALARVHFFLRELQNQRNAVERAVTLNSMDGDSLAHLGELLTFAGDFERGLELAERSKHLNPHHPGWYWYANYYQAYQQRDYVAALNFARKVNLPGHWAEPMLVAAACGQLGELDSAAKAVRDLLKLRPDVADRIRTDMEKWWSSEAVEHLIDGLRKAGLGIGDAGPSTSSAPVAVDPPTNKSRVGPTNLPKDRTRFIGRVHDLEHCARLFEDTRLLTLTGLGGSGKTRVAIKLAENLSQHFPDGVWFVDLTPLTEASSVVSAVAQVLGLKEEAGKSLDELLSHHISDQKVLLLLDNCEHLLSACADFVDNLLSSCSEVRILATSREPLSLRGEKVVALHPLEVPTSSSEKDLEALQTSDAVKLFIDRAQLVQTGFELTATNATSVAEICRKLDGIPLAIELAAARVKLLTTEQILAKLDDRFKLLSATGRTMPTRHQTLRAVIEWSYDHLSKEEQRVIRALSVFASGWTLPLAVTVAGGLDEFEMLDLHSQLVDKSIVIVEGERAGVRRYRFLETVRQFLSEQLNQKSEDKLVRDSHFGAMLSLAEQAYAERITKEEYWAEQLGIERDNLRVALEYARATDSENYLKLVGALGWFWIVQTHLFEGHEHLKAALDSSTAEPLRPARARALWGAAQILVMRGTGPAAWTLMDEAVRTWRELGDTRELALALEAVGWSYFFSGDDEDALTAFEECLRLQQAIGDRHLIIRAMVGLAQILVALGQTAEAIPMSREIIEFSKQHNDKRSEHFGWHYLADCELILGNCRESLELYKQSLKLAHALGDKVEIGCEVQGVAMSLAGLGEKELAIRFAAAVRAEWDRIGVDIQVRFWDALLERYIGAAKRAMEVEDFERESSNGRHMPFDEAVTLALGASPIGS